jgi:RNA ligase
MGSGLEMAHWALVDWVKWPHIVEYMPMSLNELRTYTATNKEGFVLHFMTGLRVKVKTAEYVRLHKLLTGITEKSIWRDYLMPGNDITPLLDHVPDEFNAWMRATIDGLYGNYKRIEDDAKGIYASLLACVGRDNRRDFANIAKDSLYAPILFNMLDGKDYSRHIWKMVEPKGATAFKCDEN